MALGRKKCVCQYKNGMIISLSNSYNMFKFKGMNDLRPEWFRVQALEEGLRANER